MMKGAGRYGSAHQHKWDEDSEDGARIVYDPFPLKKS